MKKLATVTAAMLLAANFSGAYAQSTTAKSDRQHAGHHKAAPGTTTGASMKSNKAMTGNNDELKGNSATSAGGSNSLSNTNNPGGMGNNAGPPMK
jgi:hypothetical protein